MKININPLDKEAEFVFSNDELDTIKNNKNRFIVKSEDLIHLKNHFMNIVVQLDKISDNGISQGNEEISVREVTKK